MRLAADAKSERDFRWSSKLKPFQTRNPFGPLTRDLEHDEDDTIDVEPAQPLMVNSAQVFDVASRGSQKQLPRASPSDEIASNVMKVANADRPACVRRRC